MSLSTGALPVAPAALALPGGDTDDAFVAVRPGAHGPALAEAQLRLRLLGFSLALEPTLGPETEAALRAFQGRTLLAPTGVLDHATWIALLGETSDHATSWALAAPDGALEDQAVGPLSFSDGPHRDVPGSGGYRYRQWADGALQILESPGGRGQGITLYDGPVWEAITGELGPFPEAELSAPSTDQSAPGDPTGVDGARRELVRRGSRGAAARRVQQLLVDRGFGPLGVDGVFGARSVSALVLFQHAAGLETDGICGPATWAVLCDPPAGLVPIPLPLDPQVVRQREQWREQLPRLLAATGAPLPAVVGATLRAAIDMLGCAERPDGSNGGPEIGVITEGFAMASPPWCALAVTHWVRQGTGATSWSALPWGTRNAHALSFGRWGAQTGRLLGVDEPAPPGAIFVMRRGGSGSDAAPAADPSAADWTGPGHTGLVLEDLGDHIISIDGNVGDAVRVCRRARGQILGTVRWW